MAYYFAGGMYGMDRENLEFGAVRPSGDRLPYITESEKGLSLTSHHASLYRLSEDLREAELVAHRNGGVVQSPYKVQLSEKLQDEFKQVIEIGKFYN